MRETELWRRINAALGPDYARHWAATVVLSELGSRTVCEALDAGLASVQIWRAVWRMLELPDSQR